MTDKPRIKFVITLGPASASPDVFGRLVHAGVSVARLNFSHGTQEQKKEYIETIRACAAAAERPVAIMADLCGPKIRVSGLENNALPLVVGDTVTIQRQPGTGAGGDGATGLRLCTNYSGIIDDLKIGQRILIDDGAIRMIVTEKAPDAVQCQVTTGGTVQSNKGINLPHTQINLPSITDKDWKDVDFAIQHDLDYIALSFVRSADDIRSLRGYLDSKGSKIHIVAKIEMPQAIHNLAAIIEESDAILVARGDLGVEMDLASVSLLQKEIVNACHEAGKPVIVATQMLQSMIEEPAPTRAEVSDVTNAILDGADALMLSGETAIGKYPIVAVHVLHDIAVHTRRYIIQNGIVFPPPRLLQQMHHRTAAVAHGVKAVVDDINAGLVVVWSQAGGSARYLSKHRFLVPVIALSTDPAAVRRMALYFGITPMLAQIPRHFDDLPQFVDRLCAEHHFAQPGDRVIIVAGAPLGTAGVTNSLSVHTVYKPQ